MSRRGDRASLTALIQKIREKVPGVILRTGLRCALVQHLLNEAGNLPVGPNAEHPVQLWKLAAHLFLITLCQAPGGHQYTDEFFSAVGRLAASAQIHTQEESKWQ